MHQKFPWAFNSSWQILYVLNLYILKWMDENNHVCAQKCNVKKICKNEINSRFPIFPPPSFNLFYVTLLYPQIEFDSWLFSFIQMLFVCTFFRHRFCWKSLLLFFSFFQTFSRKMATFHSFALLSSFRTSHPSIRINFSIYYLKRTKYDLYHLQMLLLFFLLSVWLQMANGNGRNNTIKTMIKANKCFKCQQQQQ